MTRGRPMTRGRITPALLAAAMLAGASVAGCGAEQHATSADEVVTTGPEPGAEIVPEPGAEIAVEPSTPAAAAPAATPGEASKDRRGAQASPTPEATGSGTASRSGSSGGPTPTATPVPPATLSPKAPTDPLVRAFCRQMYSQLVLASLYANAAMERGQHAALRKLGHTFKIRRNDDLLKVQMWGDVVGFEPATGFYPEYYGKDMRLLGITKARVEEARKVLRSNTEPFTKVADDEVDEAIVAAMIEEREDSLPLVTGPIRTEGSPRFRRFAARLDKTLRAELAELRTLKLG